MEDLDNVASVFCSTRMSFLTPEFHIVSPEFKRKVHVTEELQDETNLPMLTGRQIVFMIHAYFKINDVQDRAVSMNDVLSSECQRQSQEVRADLERNPDGIGE